MRNMLNNSCNLSHAHTHYTNKQLIIIPSVVCALCGRNNLLTMPKKKKKKTANVGIKKVYTAIETKIRSSGDDDDDDTG